MISPGQVISPQQMLTMLTDLDPVKVQLNVPERFMSRAKEGQKVELTVAAFPGEKFVGEVYFIAPQLDAVNRTGLVKAKVANSDFRLKPGMFASLDLTLKVKEDAVVVPEAALMPQGDKVTVFVVDDGSDSADPASHTRIETGRAGRDQQRASGRGNGSRRGMAEGAARAAK